MSIEMNKKLILVDLRHCIRVNNFTKKEIDFVKKHSSKDIIIFHILGERYQVRSVNTALTLFFKNFDSKNIFLICDRLFTQSDIDKFFIKNTIVVDSQLLKVAQYEDNSQFNSTINLDNDRFLFLMGKPYKINRLPFLYELYKKDLLKKCDYSFYYSSNYANECRKTMNFLSDREYKSFIKKTQKTLDNIGITIGPSSFHYSGVPVDLNLYKNTAFSVISETTIDKNNFHFISEKTWRTIANKHMFLSMSHKGYKDFLNNLGISTFDYCLKYNKQQFELDDNYELNRLTAKNIKFLFKHINKYKSKIKNDIEKNYAIYRQLVEKQRQLVNTVIENELHITDLTGGYFPLKIFNIDKKIEKSLATLMKATNEN
jgi:hypothetical protein